MKALALLALVLVSGCSSAGAGNTVQLVGSPVSGYTCFAFMNSAGEVVGGNCVKD